MIEADWKVPGSPMFPGWVPRASGKKKRKHRLVCQYKNNLLCWCGSEFRAVRLGPKPTHEDNPVTNWLRHIGVIKDRLLYL